MFGYTLSLNEISQLTLAEIRVSVDIEEARRIFDLTFCCAKSNSLDPWRGWIPALGTWRFSDVVGFEVLFEFPLAEICCSEPEDGIKAWKGYPLYVQWAREGILPPPIILVRRNTGQLVSLDRRRVLAAKDAGREKIMAWFSETTLHGRPTWQLRRCLVCKRYQDQVDTWSKVFAQVCGECQI